MTVRMQNDSRAGNVAGMKLIARKRRFGQFEKCENELATLFFFERCFGSLSGAGGRIDGISSLAHRLPKLERLVPKDEGLDKSDQSSDRSQSSRASPG